MEIVDKQRVRKLEIQTPLQHLTLTKVCKINHLSSEDLAKIKITENSG